jgi:tetratricopeptide (TPR) repeat protein
MPKVEKTIFVSYRRTNMPWALAIYQDLVTHGYDVFIDYLNIDSGDFEKIIIGNIKARAHFLVVLTPSALEGCGDPDDWIRREIETALTERKNIIPLFLESFSFGNPSISMQLTGKLAELKHYNGLNVPADYFREAMDRLRNRFLNVPLDAVVHPVSKEVRIIVEEQQSAANEAEPININQLNAQVWFERAYSYGETKNFDEAIRCYSEAIRLHPDNMIAFHNRGLTRQNKGDFDGALKDFDEAIRLGPDVRENYMSRGVARREKGDLLGAIEDFTQAIRLKPDFREAYLSRGNVYQRIGDLDKSITDLNYVIQIKPDNDLAYYNRAIIWEMKNSYSLAIDDYQKYLNLGGGIRMGDQKEVEEKIKKLKTKLTKVATKGS